MKEVKTVHRPTPRQKRAMEIFLHYAERHTKTGTPPPSLGQIMREAGYSKQMSKTPGVIMNSPAWKEFLNTIDDTEIVTKWQQWAREDDPALRSHALRAGENIMKLKDRFPTPKSQSAHLHLHNDLKDITD